MVVLLLLFIYFLITATIIGFKQLHWSFNRPTNKPWSPLQSWHWSSGAGIWWLPRNPLNHIHITEFGESLAIKCVNTTTDTKWKHPKQFHSLEKNSQRKTKTKHTQNKKRKERKKCHCSGSTDIRIHHLCRAAMLWAQCGQSLATTKSTQYNRAVLYQEWKSQKTAQKHTWGQTSVMLPALLA